MSEVDLSIQPGERVLLLGASGAGKSTLLSALAGVLGGEEEGDEYGELLVDGRHPALTHGVSGLVLQDPDSQTVLARVGDDVAFACENLGVPRDEIWPRVREALDDVGLDVDLDRPTSQMSGGQKQRLALAGVLAMRPRLLLLDEPTANLDPEGVREVSEAVARSVARSGATLVVIEHRVAIWQDLVDRVIVLGAGGGVVADGAPADVFDDASVELDAAGVWVPGRAPAHPAPALAAPGGGALRAEALAVGRVPFAARRPVVVADDIDVDVRFGEVVAVTGPNGAGKSTFALTLAGLLPPAAGRVRASDDLRGGLPPEPIGWKSRSLLTRIGTVFQEPEHQFITARVFDELAVGPRALGMSGVDVERVVDGLLHRLRLDGLRDANPFTLSGGEKRRLSVATVLASEPRVIIMDEPTFGQDARTWEVLVGLLAGQRDAGSAVVLVTHDTELRTALGTRDVALRSVGVAS